MENLLKAEDYTAEHMTSIQKSLEKLRSLSTEDTKEALQSRIDEQSSLIIILKQRADDLLLRYQAQQKINAGLEAQVTDYREQLYSHRKRVDLMERRFMDLAGNNESIIAFMDEYKIQNVQLKLENKELRAENDTLFSRKLQDKEVLVQKLTEEVKELTDKYTNKENEYREKLAECQSRLLEQAAQQEENKALLQEQLDDAKKQQRDAAEMCTDLKTKLQKAEQDCALKEKTMRESITNLNKDKDKLLNLSIERGKVIQEKQNEMKKVEDKWREEKKARLKAEDRFEQDAEAVNADARVKSLQTALDESLLKYEKFKKDFEAFREHNTNLLTQERELNKKLRHMIG